MKHKSSTPGNWTRIYNGILDSESLSEWTPKVWAHMWRQVETWIFVISVMARKLHLSKEKIRKSLKELEDNGFLVRTEVRKQGRYAGFRADLYENPQDNPLYIARFSEADGSTEKNEPNEDSTVVEEPYTDFPHTESHSVYKNEFNTNHSNYKSLHNQSIHKSFTEVEREIKERIQFESLVEQYGHGTIQNIVNIVVGSLMTSGGEIEISKNRTVDADYFRKQMRMLSYDHIVYVLRRIELVSPHVNNPKSYFLSALLNATESLNLGYEFGDDERL